MCIRDSGKDDGDGIATGLDRRGEATGFEPDSLHLNLHDARLDIGNQRAAGRAGDHCPCRAALRMNLELGVRERRAAQVEHSQLDERRSYCLLYTSDAADERSSVD